MSRAHNRGSVSWRSNPDSTGDQLIYEILDGATSLLAVPVAYQLGLFDLLADEPCSAESIAGSLGLHLRPTEILLTVCASLGLAAKSEAGFGLSQSAKLFLWSGSPFFQGTLLDCWIDNFGKLSLDTVRESLVTNRPYGRNGGDWLQTMEKDAVWALQFTQMMHAHSQLPSHAWPARVNLSQCGRFLDVGGGSGIHSVAALRRWTSLQAVVLESPAVCRCAHHFLKQANDVAGRLEFRSGDMWVDRWPEADVHFFSDVFHDWPPEQCLRLASRSFESLSSGGRILLHEMLLDDDKTGPPAVAFSSLSMLLWSHGQQFSGLELSRMLSQAGFVEAEVFHTYGCWSLVSARKP